MADFLLELRSEEIPARMQEKARADLERLFVSEMGKAGLTAKSIETYATPRRLVLIARDLPPETKAVSEETKGPKSSAPPQALEGFLRKTGLSREQLVERDGILYAVTEKPGRATADVLAEAIPAIVRAFPWPKSMRWGAASASTESPRWVRPLQGIVALLGEDVVPCEIAGVQSGAATVGHRFHHPGIITIGSANDYVEKLRACHVIVDGAERRRIIAEGATKAAADAGLELIEDEGLLFENAGLTEWPVPLLGRFDEAFLTVPPEVIQLTARVNQKYFVCKVPPRASSGRGTAEGGGGAGREADGGTLANAFVCTANIDATDGGKAIIEGNQKVLAARLADARFFWDQDLKVALDDQAKKLGQIVFHEKLGTVADKVDRVAKLARWLVEEGIVGPDQTYHIPVTPAEAGVHRAASAGGEMDPGLRRGDGTGSAATNRAHLAALAERAARLAKADLVTGMVGEFPELQGQMGGHYARAQGEDPQVADAVRDHYRPVGQGDEVPTAPVTVAVSLADKLDTLICFFAVGEQPTGSRDPFALRRAALGILASLVIARLRLPMRDMIGRHLIILQLNMLGQVDASEFPELHDYGDENLSFSTDGDDDVITYGDKELYRAKSPDRPTLRRLNAVGDMAQIEDNLLDFFADRLKVQQREAGVRHDLIDAVFALGGEDDLVRLLARVHALQAFMATADGANLLAGYKRAANILKKEGWGESTTQPTNTVIPAEAGIHRAGSAGGAMDPGLRRDDGTGSAATAQKPLSYTPEPAETALTEALDSAAPRAASAIETEDFEGAMAALASLRAPIDAFFDSVTVNDPAPEKREARLNLLARMRDAVHSVADFSKIEG